MYFTSRFTGGKSDCLVDRLRESKWKCERDRETEKGERMCVMDWKRERDYEKQ